MKLRPYQKYEIIRKLNKDIQMICDIAKVSKSGYYCSLKNNNADKDKKDYLIIKEIFDKSRSKYGWRSIQMHLRLDYGLTMNHKKIIRIKNKYNLTTKIRRKNPYKMIMKKTQEHHTFNNILDRKFKQNVPGKVLCTDITYLYYGQCSKAYLSAVKDIASKEIVSWQLSNNLSMKFVLDSIDNLKNIKTISCETIIHSDQGFHYTNPEFIEKIKVLNLRQSMSRKGNCIDNAPMESFFGHLKDEIDCKEIKTFSELNDIINKYMNYYNNYRYQWNLKKMIPVKYRHHLLSKSV
ncbi:MAG: IS3 family transposase [Patescibacteria group bacterium]|nr:IS3 family transposase [Patescibacteria group bacterium]